MAILKRIVLDILKPHRPGNLEFTIAVADSSVGCRVKLIVTEVDEQTETVVLYIEGADLQYQKIATAIADLGGSVHSIDEVEVESAPES